MLNHPDTRPSDLFPEKMVLPATVGAEEYVTSDQHSAQFYPNLLIRQKTPPAPKKILPRLAWYWRKDPAYKVFMIALVMVVVASVVLVSLASASLFGRSSSGASFSQTPPSKVAPGGPVDLHPAPDARRRQWERSEQPAARAEYAFYRPSTYGKCPTDYAARWTTHRADYQLSPDSDEQFHG